MASNGLINMAKNGKCRICYRTRSTDEHVEAVGEVRHGFATGHIWECINIEDCEKTALKRIKDNHLSSEYIKHAMQQGRFREYVWFS